MHKLYEASSNEASYDWGNNYDRPSCHPKTREGYLSQLEAWSQKKSSDHPGIFWIYGPAGTGKSAIMQSFCERLQGESRLGASFFFKKDHLSRGNVMKVFPTIAYHLARASPELELAITTGVREDSAIFSKSLDIQLQKLIIDPCQTVTLALPLVIAIDGLDECHEEKSQQEILRCLGTAHDHFKSQLAILIASRPEPDIQSVFQEPCLMATETLEIHGSKDDVRTYLVDEFRQIRETYSSLHAAPVSWPGDDVVEQFVTQSSGHFVYASTVVRFIDDKDWNPEERLRIIRGIEKQELFSTSPFSTLDRLYTGILADVPNRPRLLRILSILAAGLQLSNSQMGQLLGLESIDIQTTLRRLHSLINVPAVVGDDEDTDDDITVHHASFLDFLNDPARSAQFHFNGTAQQSLALHIIRVYSEPSEIGSWPVNSRVWHRLNLSFITTTSLSPDMIAALRQINLDLAIGEDGLSQVVQWIKEQNGPGDLTQQWEDYASMRKLQDILSATDKLEVETDDMPEALETVSPTLVQIIQTCRLLESGLVVLRWILDYNWGEIQSIIAPISFWKDIDIQNLCSEISSPLRIQELNPDQALQKLATRCIEILCLQFQRKKEGWVPGIIRCAWSHIVRACLPTSELLETVQRLVTAENMEIIKNYDYSYHIHNLVVWLEAHPDAPLHLVERVKAFDNTKYHQEYENDWKEWTIRTGLGGS
ncbi:hypothetical protein R3P38DRAFT_326377 [Favolaschia claudopus]|uniref:Nephrocystin 3-like N-terminal domain-containing protein n=1 Tax=Favolaschia claudopus TaxID=2862362 RepID=A0AAW0CVF8_9AGAR